MDFQNMFVFNKIVDDYRKYKILDKAVEFILIRHLC